MRKTKRKRGERQGWKLGDTKEFLGLSAEEASYIELKLALSRRLRMRREAKKLTQGELADQLGSSQSRVAKMEAGDPTVSIDLLVRSLLSLGATKRDLAKMMASGQESKTKHVNRFDGGSNGSSTKAVRLV